MSYTAKSTKDFLEEKNKKKPKLSLDPWQEEIRNYNGNIILCTGRQIGKTTIFAIKASEYMIKNKNAKIIAVSLTEDQAFLMRTMVEDYIKQHFPAYLKVAKKDKPTKNRIKLANGSTYTVRPVGNTGDAVRGFTGDILIVDEASFMPEMLWLASKPTLLTTGGQIWMCSTPHVKKGWFFEQYEKCKERFDGTRESERFEVWHKSSEDVIFNREISSFWTEEKRNNAITFLKDEKNGMSESRYAQEYLGLFMDDIQRFFSDEWIDKVCTAKPEPIFKEADYYIGIDIARLGGDETSYEIVKKINKDNLIHVYNETETKKLTTHTIKRILEFDRAYNFQRIYIDAGSGSLGVGVFDHLINEERTKRKVIAINNRQILLGRETLSGQKPQKQRLLKEDLYENLKMLGEFNRIKLLDDEKVRLSLRSMVFEIKESDNGLSKLKISGNYAHICEGLVRACYASKEKNLKPFISSFKL